MKAYKNYLIIITILVSVYLLLFIPDMVKSSKGTKTIFPKYDKDSIVSINISKDKMEGVWLQLKEGIWTVIQGDRNIPAGSARVENLLNAISELSSQRSFNGAPEELDKYNLTPDKAILVSVNAAKGPIASFMVGKSGRDFVSTFFKISDDKKVHVSPRSLIRFVDPSPDSWYDKIILKLDTADIVKLDLPKVKLVRGEDNIWRYSDTDKVRVDESKLYAYLNIFTNFRTNGFVLDQDLKSSGVEHGQAVIVLEKLDGSIIELIRGKDAEKISYMGLRIDGIFTPWVYTFDSARVKGLLKEPQYFIHEEKDSSEIKINK